MPEKDNTYQTIVAISRDFLGSQADTFIDRHIRAHLSKKPSNLTKDDVLTLIPWIRPAFALLIDDSALVEAYTNRLQIYANSTPPRYS